MYTNDSHTVFFGALGLWKDVHKETQPKVLEADYQKYFKTIGACNVINIVLGAYQVF